MATFDRQQQVYLILAAGLAVRLARERQRETATAMMFEVRRAAVVDDDVLDRDRGTPSASWLRFSFISW